MTSKQPTNAKSPKLSDTQLIILSEAAQRTSNLVVLPPRLKGSAGSAAISALQRRGYIEEIDGVPGGALGEGSFFEGPAGPICYRVTRVALDLLGIEGDAKAAVATESQREAPVVRPRKAAKKSKITAKVPAQKAPPRGSTKQQALLALLERSKGASLEELMSVAGWQAHSVRGFLSGTVKGKLGRSVERVTDTKRGNYYRITS